MKKYIGLLIMICLSLCGCSSKSEAESRTIPSDKIKEIFITTEGENIVVNESEGKDIQVELNNDRLQVQQDGSQLNISVKESSSFINFKSETLTVSLPKNFNAALHIKTLAGKVTGGNISNEKFFVASESGTIDLKNIKGEFMKDGKITTIAGDINVKLDSFEQGYNVDITTTSGKIKSDLNLSHLEEEKSNKNLRGYTGERGTEKSNLVIETGTGTISIQ